MSTEPEFNEPELDIEALFEQLQRGGRERELVASKRPTSSELADALRQLADLIYSGFDFERVNACAAKGIGPRDTYSWQPRAGSRAEQDVTFVDDLLGTFVADHDLVTLEFAETNPFRNSIVWGIGLLAQAVQTAVDHMHGIADSLESGQTIRAPLTMSRTVLEAAATGCFISDATADSRERLRRTHNLRMEDMKEGANHRSDDESEDYLTGLEELVAFASASGFEVRQPRLSHLAPTVPAPEGEREAVRYLVERILPGVGLSTYRTLSTVAHCRPNVGDVLPDDYSLPHEIDVWRKAEKIASYAIPALIAVREMTERVTAYLGWDDHEIGTTIYEVLDFISVGAGWKDAQIREHLGLPPT
ncbi:hypothetical protein [Nocardioides sp. LML1-1-1.1]|uniref:hypothetical protein n=1 Tax=Nocardioides sp. LML1-1-1.1 TaxID=3135248 RepID=UPI00341D7736